MARSTASWREVGFDEAFQRLKLKAFEIPTKDYQVSGTYPIIDQGDGAVAGYIDREDPISDVPFIVFGDHTTIVKYVDQPCFIGSQGVVPLKARECYDPYFLYLMLGRTRIPALGYSRHFRELENKTFPLPPLAEQRKIAEILRTWDEAIETAEAELKAKQERKRWMMDRLMSRRPAAKLPSMELGIGTIEQFELAGLIKLTRGKVISKKDIDGIPGSYPVYSSSVLNNGLFGRYGDYMFDEEMITWSVDGGGDFFYRPKHRFSVTNVCGCMQVDAKRINCVYLASQLQYLHKRLTFDYQSKAHPSVIRKMYSIWIPSIEDQVSIADAISAFDEQMQNSRNLIQALHAQKRGLMQKLLTGEVRVAA